MESILLSSHFAWRHTCLYTVNHTFDPYCEKETKLVSANMIGPTGLKSLLSLCSGWIVLLSLFVFLNTDTTDFLFSVF